MLYRDTDYILQVSPVLLGELCMEVGGCSEAEMMDDEE